MKKSRLQLSRQFTGKPFQAPKNSNPSSLLTRNRCHIRTCCIRVTDLAAFTVTCRGWHVTFEVQLSLGLIRSPTQKVGMDLVVVLQAMQQLTTSATFFQIRRVYSQEYRYRDFLLQKCCSYYWCYYLPSSFQT